MDQAEIVERIIRLIPETCEFHSPDNELYKLFDEIIYSYFADKKQENLLVEPLKGIKWPNICVGNIHSYDFFGLTPMIHFVYYYKQRENYKVAFDIGANIGLDSIILNKFGYEVYSFEPDEQIYSILLNNLGLNSCKNIHTYPKAISDKKGKADFVRVKGNTTASHISGARDFYGDTDHFQVETITYDDVGVRPDIMKINVEGHEKEIVPTIPGDQWEKCDAFIGIHSEENQKVIYDYFQGIGVNIFSQKIGWKKAKTIEDVPATNKDGYIFASKKDVMPW